MIFLSGKNKQRLARLAAGALSLALAACGLRGGEVRNKTAYYSMNIQGYALAEEGLYHVDSRGFLYYFDYESSQDVLVCTKPNCTHESWNEETPDEERCLAYVCTAGGFIFDSKLYLFMPSHNPKNQFGSDLIQSRPNRTETKQIASIPTNIIRGFALHNEILYLPINKPILEKKEDGSLLVAPKNECSLYAVNLKNGSVSQVISSRSHYNNALLIRAAADGKLFLSYTYMQRELKGGDVMAAGFTEEYYIYHIAEDKETEFSPKIAAAVLADAVWAGNDLYCTFYDLGIYGDPSGSGSCSLLRCSPDNGKLEELAKSPTKIHLIDGKFLIEAEQNERRFDPATGVWEQLPAFDLSHIYGIITVSDEYLLLRNHEDIESGESGPCLLKKEDLLAEKRNFVPLIFEHNSP